MRIPIPRGIVRSLVLALLALMPATATNAQDDVRDPADDVDSVEAARAAARALRDASRSEKLPAAGDPAPELALRLLAGSNAPDHAQPDAGGRVRLADHRGKRPVVLIFGSYT